MNTRERRWYGWGYMDTDFDLESRAGAWPFLQATLQLSGAESLPAPERDSIEVRATRLDEAALGELRAMVGADGVQTSPSVRVAHSRGQSYRDLIRWRRGELDNPTDVVVLPGQEDEVFKVLQFAMRHEVAVVPFGGGTSVVGGIEPLGHRPTLTLNLARLNRVLDVNDAAQTVTAEAGCPGPDLERRLNERGLTLGHFPQSFEFSTLGGWIATRGAGYASTRYGKIEEMVVSARLITPSGIIETRHAPATAAGPSLLHLILGSEGVLGVVTQASLRLHRQPEATWQRAFVLPAFRQGGCAVRDILQADLQPSLVRLSDEQETRTLSAFSERGSTAAQAAQTGVQSGPGDGVHPAAWRTFAHHHGVGYEHAQWLHREDSHRGVEVLRAVKRILDPQAIMNPGKLLA